MSCTQIMKVLADQTRFAVLERLLERALHVHELNAKLRLEPTLPSHHLKVLREAGLVVAERDGKQVLYRLAPTARSTRNRRTLDFGCCKLQFNKPGASANGATA